MNLRSVVLLSSGLDSTVNLYAALRESEVALALTFNYGQRAAQKEISQARKICELLKVRHQVVELPFFRDFTRTSLVNREAAVPVKSEVKIDDQNQSLQTAERVWVPNRNGIFLNVAAAYAEGLKADFLVPGFNLEEAQTFPDNSEAYLKKAEEAFQYSTAHQLRTKCYTIRMTKSQIFKLGLELNVNFDLVWPCYLDGEEICGQCESCQRFLKAKNEAKMG